MWVMFVLQCRQIQEACIILTLSSSKVTTLQDAHGSLGLQVYLGSNTYSSVLYIGKIFVVDFTQELNFAANLLEV